MEAPGFFLFISTTITLVTAMAITLYVRSSVGRAVHAKIEEESLRMENREIEEKLIVARQLATIGALAGGLTYHLDGTLRGLKQLMKILGSTAGSYTTVKSLSKMISEQLSDAITVSNRVCQATYPDRMQLSRVSGADILSRVTKSMYNPNSVEMEIAIACQDDIIFANVQLVQQVFENVLVNALSALAVRGGKVHISCSNPGTNKKIIGDSLNVANIPHLRIEITDNGAGMTHEMLENIFLPQFAKEASVSAPGAGLGLALCYAIMQMLQGDITISSTQGKGTIVSLRFPLAMGREDKVSLDIATPPLSSEDILHIQTDSIIGNA